MESLEFEYDKRKKALEDWLRFECGFNHYQMQTIAPDASFRRYFRVATSHGSFIAMDADPKHEDCSSYVAIGKCLRAMGLQAPEMLRTNIEQGFLLITDFGDATYLKLLNNGANADALYTRALKSLAILQTCREVPGKIIPLFGSEMMLKEWAWYKEWFLNKFLSIEINDTVLDHCYARIMESALAQPQVFMHRDYHSANLMLLANEDVGILDFQDAFIGPLTYDLVSLLRDCYIDWPNEKVHAWVIQYWKMLMTRSLISVDSQTFLQWFDLMGLQRHLKALITFSRKYIRDHNSNYLQYIPRTLHYLQIVSQHYSEFAPLNHHLTYTVQPAFKRVWC